MRSTWPNQFNRCAPYLTFYILPHALRAPPIPCNSALSKVLQRATNFSHYHSPHAIALDAVMNSLVVLAARDWCDSAIEPAATHTHTYWISLIGAQSVQITTHTHTHPHTHTHTHTHTSRPPPFDARLALLCTYSNWFCGASAVVVWCFKCWWKTDRGVITNR